MEKLLSICIPAYNDPKSLGEVMHSLSSELTDPAISELVEVVIRDDASPSGSLNAVVKPYQEQHTNIHFSRNKENLGFNKNVLAVVSDASGEFCWLMSDNDAFVPGAITKAVKLLKQNLDVNYAYVKTINYDKDLKNPLKRSQGNGDEIIKINSAEEFIQNYDLPGFLSSQIIRKKLWDGVNKKKYLDNYWVHTSTILEFLPQGKILYIGEALIKARNQNAWAEGGTGLYTFLALREIINNLDKFGYSQALIKHFNERFAKDLLEVVAYAKVRGLKTSGKLIRTIIKCFYKSPIRALLAIIILLIPKFIIKSVSNIKKKLS